MVTPVHDSGASVRKLSDNQLASLAALRAVTVESGVDLVSRAAWCKACPPGVSVSTKAMVKTGKVVAVTAVVSRNGKVIELYKLAD